MNLSDEPKSIWEELCKRAADKDGISVDEVKRKLESGIFCLEISATLDLRERKGDDQ